MQDLVDSINELLTGPRLLAGLRAVLLLLGGALAARLVGRSIEHLIAKKASPQQAALARRLTAYLVFALGFVMALRQLGFELTALLGAAGIVTVAVGFAAQTSASNIISGLFLMGERSFGIGSVIRVGTTTGEVTSIDMLSVKLRTFDNLLVRLPNEMLVKSEITTLSHFPIRRVDVALGCAYEQDLEHMRDVLMRVAYDNPLCLEEPKPLFIVSGFGPDAITVQFSAWTTRESFLDMRTSLLSEIKRAFDAEAIEFPYPQRMLHHRGEVRAEDTKTPRHQDTKVLIPG